MRARRSSFAAVAAAATVVLVAAAAGIDAARALENPPRPPRVLFIAIDAVPFATMAESAADERNGFLRSLRGPVPLDLDLPVDHQPGAGRDPPTDRRRRLPRLRGEALRLGLEPRERRRALRLRAVPLALVLRLEGRDPVSQGDVRHPADQGGAPGHPRVARRVLRLRPADLLRLLRHHRFGRPSQEPQRPAADPRRARPPARRRAPRPSRRPVLDRHLLRPRDGRRQGAHEHPRVGGARAARGRLSSAAQHRGRRRRRDRAVRAGVELRGVHRGRPRGGRRARDDAAPGASISA